MSARVTSSTAAAAPTRALPRGFSAQTVLSYPRVAADIGHAGLALARVNVTAPVNLMRDRARLERLGFVERAPGYLEHPDGGWLAFVQGAMYMGAGKHLLVGHARPVAQMQRVAPSFQQFQLAIGEPAIHGLRARDLAADATPLTSRGFRKVGDGAFRHRDGSWIAITDGRVTYGHGSQALTRAPTAVCVASTRVDAGVLHDAADLFGLPTQAEAARATLLQRGFKERRPGYFEKSTMWAAIERDAVVAGISGSRFRTLPDLSNMAKAPSAEKDRWRAVAQTAAFTATQRDLRRRLEALGFTAQRDGTFTHPDGSWVVARGGRLLRGADNHAFSDVPKPVKPPQTKFSALPSRAWGWFKKHTALGHTPVLSSRKEARELLPGLGYKAPRGDGHRWTHPDGSWFEVGRSMRPGFQKWHIGQLPYNNRIASS